MPDFGEYIVYVDESGDHGLQTIDPSYPVFVLSFCIFRKDDYAGVVAPALQNFKFRFFGHDLVILHNHEIRKALGDFRFLFDRENRHAFMEALNAVIDQAPFTVVAAVINKLRLRQQYVYPANPYDIALCFCMERAYAFLEDRQQHNRLTHVVVEKRGVQEDKDLELAFRRVAQGGVLYPSKSASLTRRATLRACSSRTL